MPNPVTYPSVPALLTQFQQQAKSVVYGQQLLTDGQGSYPSDFVRPQTYAKLLSNLLQSRRQNVWTNRDCGFTRWVNTVFNGGAAFLELGQYIDGQGNDNLLMQVGSYMIQYNLATNTANNLSTTMPLNVPCIRQFQPAQAGATPTCIITSAGQQPSSIVNGTGSPTWTQQFGLNGATPSATLWGSTASPLPAKNYSKPQICEAFLNRMVYGAFIDTTGVTTFDLIVTNAGYYNTCTLSATPVNTDGDIVQVPPSIGPIKAIKSVQLSNQSNQQAVLIGGTKGVALLTGTGALSFASVVLTTEFGIPSNRALLQVMNDIIFLSQDGIRSFSATIVNANLLNSSLAIPVQDVVNTWDQANLQNAFVVPNRFTKDIQFWVPTIGSGGQCNTGIVMNYGTSQAGAQNVPSLDFQFSIRSGFAIPCAFEFPNPNNNMLPTMFSGGYTGLLYQHYNGNTADGVALPWTATFPLFGQGDPYTSSTPQKLLVICDGGNQQFYGFCSALTEMNGGFILKQPPQQGNYFIQSGNGFLNPNNIVTELSEWELSLSAFPANYVQFFEYEPVVEGRFLELQLNGFGVNDVIDLVGAQYLLTAGGTRR